MRGTTSFQLFPGDPLPAMRCRVDDHERLSGETVEIFSFDLASYGDYGNGCELHFSAPFDQMGEILRQIKSEYDAMSVQRAAAAAAAEDAIRRADEANPMYAAPDPVPDSVLDEAKGAYQ